MHNKKHVTNMPLFKKIRIILAAALKILYLFVFEVFRRLHSETVYHIYRRDLATTVDIPEPKIRLTLRKLDKNDIPKLLNFYADGLTSRQIWERIRILLMIRSEIQTPYVVVTDTDEPCHIAWLIDCRENEKIQSYFKKRIPLLKPDEVLFELVFTLEQYRALGIQSWRIKQFTEKSAAAGARQALVFIKSKNIASINNVIKNAFEPYMTRTDRWRFFRCKSEFKLLTPTKQNSE